MTKFVVVDTESKFDPYLREAYKAIDPPKENSKPREGCRIITAISTFEIELNDEGRVSTGAVTSSTGRDHTETSLLAALVELPGPARGRRCGDLGREQRRRCPTYHGFKCPSSRWTAPKIGRAHV